MASLVNCLRRIILRMEEKILLGGFSVSPLQRGVRWKFFLNHKPKETNFVRLASEV